MKVLITGGYGFIGSYVSELFCAEGHDVFILDNLSAGDISNVRSRHISIIEDVQSDRCEAIFREHGFDLVVHLAAQTLVQHSMQEPVNDSRVNVGGLVNMLHLSAKYSIRQFVFASTAAVYGNSEEPVLTEQTVCKPMSPYGMNKWIGEYNCRQWESMFGLNNVCLRFSNVYGPKYTDGTEGSVIPLFIGRLLEGKPLPVYGDGNQTRDFLFVEDLSKAIYHAAMKGLSGIYNVSASVPYSVNDVIGILKSFDPEVKAVYMPARQGDIRHSVLDSSRLRHALGWEPQYSLEEGIGKTFRHLKEHADMKNGGAAATASQ